MSESNSKRFSPEQKSQAWAVSGYNIENKDVTSKHQTLRQFNSDINLNFQRGYGSSVVTAVNPVSFKRNSDPNKYWSPVITNDQSSVTIVDKPIERIVEVFHRVPIDKVVERNVESIKVEEKHLEKDIKITQVVPVIQEVKKEIVYEKEVLKEEVQEIVVDKYVERVEVIKEVPTIRYVDRVVTREIPVTQVVERVVEVLKERPVEVIKEVPIYVKADVTDFESRTEAYSGAQSMMITSGQAARAGVGMVLERIQNGTIIVRKLVHGSPAADCMKIQENDVLLEVDGTQVTFASLDDIFARVNGVEGSYVQLTLSREGKPFSVRLMRAPARPTRPGRVSTEQDDFGQVVEVHSGYSKAHTMI